MAGMGPVNDVLGWFRTSRLLPQAAVDTMPQITRGGKYGEMAVELLSGKSHKFNDEGSYFHCSSPTPGTGLAQIAAPTSYVTTSPYIIVQNTNAPGGKNVLMDYIRLYMTVVNTSGTQLNYVVVTDAINRWSSGGSGGGVGISSPTLNGPYPTNMQSVQGSLTQVYAGALVAATASNSARMYSHGVMRTQISVVGDSYTFDFGAARLDTNPIAKNGTAPSDFSIPLPSISIPPGASLLLYLWSPSQSGAGSYEIDIGFIER